MCNEGKIKMNSETGQISLLSEKQLSELNKLRKKAKGNPFEEMFGSKNGVPNMIPVEDGDMTEKQEETHHVSKFDNKSTLGKKFTGSRQVRRRKEREYIKQKR